VQIYIARLRKFSDALTAENKNIFSFAAKVQTVGLQFNIRSSGGRLFHTRGWSSHCKVLGADGSTSPWNVQGSGVGGPQRTSTSHGRHKGAVVVREVGRCQAMGALDLHMAQLMPLPLTVSCFSKIQIGFTFLVPAHPGSPGQRAAKRVMMMKMMMNGESAVARVTSRVRCCQTTKLELLKHFETTGDQVQSSLESHIDNFVERIHSRLTDPLRQRIQNIRRELQASLSSSNYIQGELTSPSLWSRITIRSPFLCV